MQSKMSASRAKAAVCNGAALLALLAAGNAYAVWDTTYRTITHIYPHDGGVTFNVDGAVIMPSAPCGNRFVLLLGSPNYNAKVAALLSMHAQGRRVQIYYDAGASSSCDIPVGALISEP
jgi:hypothetical protein